MKQTFGQSLKEYRRLRNISQRELAHKVGVDFTYISKLENDRLPPPSAATITKIAEILNTPQELLFATSGKVNNELKEVISGNPEAIKFLNEVKRMDLTGVEWNLLLENLKRLR